MPEETPSTPPVEEPTDSQRSDTTAILDEFGKLGNKVAAAFHTAWESEERKKTEDEIRKALRMAGDRMDEIAEDVRKSEITKDLQTQATKTIDAVQKSDVTKKAKQGLLSGLKKLNEELTGLLEKSPAEKAADAGQAAAQAGEKAAEEAAEAMQEAAESAKETLKQ
jgi:hypothetical protein